MICTQAAFTTSARGDPWVPAFAGRVVRAAFTGCTPRYLSPEGLRVHAVLARAASRDEYEGLRRRHAMTPAVSDCWAAGLVILELHKPRDAAWRPGDAGDVAREAADAAARGGRAAAARRLAGGDALAAWLAGGDGAMAARLAGAVAPAATGAALLDALLGDDDAVAAAAFPRAPRLLGRALAAACRRRVQAFAVPPAVARVLAALLAPDVAARPRDAAAAAEALGGPRRRTRGARHSDASVRNTLRSLALAFDEAGNASEDALATLREWVGVASRRQRPEAVAAFLAAARAGQESEIPNFKGSSLGRFPLVSADFWTSDHLSERSRSVNAFPGTRARGTLTLKRR